jgi:succinoglycan biosynthesis protein ExoM
VSRWACRRPPVCYVFRKGPQRVKMGQAKSSFEMSVVVAVCTYRRPKGLMRLLASLAKLDHEGPMRTIVVENDPSGEGGRVCEEMASSYRWPLSWFTETQSGMSFARNRAVVEALKSSPEFIAMLDDDEWVSPTWLKELLRVQEITGADIVGGPVVAIFGEYDPPPPMWIRRWYGLERNLPDQSRCELYGAGNFLARSDCFRGLLPEPFDPRFAQTGGEDFVFFATLAKMGYASCWARNAVAFEEVPPERKTERWLRHRLARRGNVTVRAQRVLRPGFLPEIVRALKTLAWLFGSTVLYLTSLFGKEYFLRSKLRFSYVMGRLGGHFNKEISYYGSNDNRIQMTVE